MESNSNQEYYLRCERNYVFMLLMAVSGMMGAYTFILRGGAFCNAQTANIVIMSIAFGEGRWRDGLYFLIPFAAYIAGTFLSEALPSTVKHHSLVRWDTLLIAIETFILFVIGLVPLTIPHQIIQIIINFIAAMQYNTFRQAEGIPMATTFCTNHVRQLGVAAAKIMRKHDTAAAHRGKIHLLMLLSFFGGGVLLSFSAPLLQEKSIWLAIVPLLIILVNLIHADLVSEHDELSRTPHGH
ncbi:MAG: DUF1275 domain-containing protein [Butyricicoccus pullicaecorum]|nr:DUF1275 domain-containing protein [Butyricicoccus pullicaecorum]